NLWTVELQSSPSLTEVFLQACPISGCTWETVTEDTIISVPEPCQSGFCMVLRYTDGSFGAFGPGFTLPVYIGEGGEDWNTHWNNQWIGGPTVSLGGMNFSSGGGTNGDGIQQAILDGGQTLSGGYAGLYDDGFENADDAWSVYFKGDGELTHALFEICPMDVENYEHFTADGETIENRSVNTPYDCINAQYIAYGDFPVEKIRYEISDNQFTKVLHADLVDVDSIDGDSNGLLCDTSGVGDLTGKVALISRGSCPFAVKINNAEALGAIAAIIYNNSPGMVTMDTIGSTLPAGSISQADGFTLKAIAPIEVQVGPDAKLCTILRWTDAWMGAFGPGLSWPVYYQQDFFDNAWMGGPNLSIAGMSFSDGNGTNGDSNMEFVFRGGQTSPNNGYSAIHDDNSSVGENNFYEWNILFDPQDDLTAVSYFIFPHVCSKTIFEPSEEVFGDVNLSYWAFAWISRLYRAGITAGCSLDPLNYCPENNVNRAEMAVFLERGIKGSSYTPPPVGDTTGFSDVGNDFWAATWIKQLAADGITAGCGGGNYCPNDPVTRAQMAIFLLRAEHGSEYTPPDIGESTGFDDVPTSHWAAPWIKQLAAEGITSGCGGSNYCPDQSVTRAQMATFLVRTFGLP
ncbi:MAG: S-layer homology domain-containing protein, partial [Anaerolineales bacterium]